MDPDSPEEIAKLPPELAKQAMEEATKRAKVTAAGWLAGIAMLGALAAVNQSPVWPTAFGAIGIAAMVAVVCYFILRQ